MGGRDDASNPTSKGDARGRNADTPGEIPARGWKDVAVRVKNEIGDDHTVLAAAGVAFFGFLAMIPALAAVVSIAGLVTGPDTLARRAEELFGALPTEAQDLLVTQLESIAEGSSGSLSFALVFGVLLSLWSASSGVGHLIEGVNVAYDEHDHRNFFVKKAMALAFTLGAVALVVVAVTGLTALPTILDAIGITGTVATVVQLAWWPALALLFMSALATLYRYAPHRDEPEWRWVTWGAVIAVVVWIVASIGFKIYAATLGSYNESYGTLAAVVVMLLWLFISAFAVLLGAQVNSELERQTAQDTTEGPDEPMGQRDAVVADEVAGADSAGDSTHDSTKQLSTNNKGGPR